MDTPFGLPVAGRQRPSRAWKPFEIAFKRFDKINSNDELTPLAIGILVSPKQACCGLRNPAGQ